MSSSWDRLHRQPPRKLCSRCSTLAGLHERLRMEELSRTVRRRITALMREEASSASKACAQIVNLVYPGTVGQPVGATRD